MKPTRLLLTSAAVSVVVLHTAHAAIINIGNVTQTPTANELQQTQINTLNDAGLDVSRNVDGSVSYVVTTFTFGADSQAHIQSRFNATGGQNRLGILAQDTGNVSFISSGDPGRTNSTLAGGGSAGFMAGQSVTFIIRQYFHSTNDALRGTLGAGDDMLMNVWINPTGSSTETAVSPGDTNMLNDGDLHTLWNSNTYRFYTQEITNQGTPSGAGDNLITNTTILTGANATFANALALATIPEPSAALLGGLGLLGLLRRRR